MVRGYLLYMNPWAVWTDLPCRLLLLSTDCGAWWTTRAYYARSGFMYDGAYDNELLRRDRERASDRRSSADMLSPQKY